MELTPFTIESQQQVQFMYDVRTSPEVSKNLFGNPPANLDQHIDWLKKQENIRDIFIITTDIQSEVFIGYCHIYNITEKSVEVGWAFHPGYHNKGYGAEAVSMLIKKCQKLYPGREVELYVKNDNTPAVILYVKAGFLALEVKDNILHMKKTSI